MPGGIALGGKPLPSSIKLLPLCMSQDPPQHLFDAIYVAAMLHGLAADTCQLCNAHSRLGKCWWTPHVAWRQPLHLCQSPPCCDLLLPNSCRLLSAVGANKHALYALLYVIAGAMPHRLDTDVSRYGQPTFSKPVPLQGNRQCVTTVSALVS